MNNRKSNPIVMAIVVVCIIITYLISDVVVTKKEAELEAQRIEAERQAEEARKLAEAEAAAKAEAEKKNEFLEGIDPNSLSDALFIGDSRTVGIDAYGNLDEATYFADVGSSIYNIKDANLKVSGVGTTSLAGLLKTKEFRKIYVMLGYNEIGYDVEQTIQRNEEFVAYLREAQPTAVIILQANLHIAEKVFTDVENNVRLDKINLGIRKIADNEKVFYIDGNSLFDDENGNLNPELTSDGVHLYAEHYNGWCDWIREETKKIFE